MKRYLLLIGVLLAFLLSTGSVLGSADDSQKRPPKEKVELKKVEKKLKEDDKPKSDTSNKSKGQDNSSSKKKGKNNSPGRFADESAGQASFRVLSLLRIP